MSFSSDVNMFIPRKDILEKYMEGYHLPRYVDSGTNDGEDYAAMVACLLKYGKHDFYGKLVFRVESYSSNGYDVRHYAHIVYQESLTVSPSEWEECMYGFAGMPNLFQSIALLKTDVLGGRWIGIGYMDFDYARKRLAVLVQVFKANNMYYEGTDILNFDMLKTVGDVLRGIHNGSSLMKHNFPLTASMSSEYSSLYSSHSAGDVSFRGLLPAELEIATNVIVNWVKQGYSRDEILDRTLKLMEELNPDVLWELISCGVVDNYGTYVGLPKEYVKALVR